MSLNILKKNISAIKLAIQLNKEEKNPTQEDLAILNPNKNIGVFYFCIVYLNTKTNDIQLAGK